jgi:hypothetical protein
LSQAAVTTLDQSLTYAGAFSEDATSTLGIAAGASLVLAGPAVIAGAVSGAGTLLVTGSMVAFAAGASLGLAGIDLQGGSVAINGTLVFAGAFSDAGTLTLATTDTLALTGGSVFGPGALVTGPGTLALSNATVSALAIGGSATLSDVGMVNQTGSITLGDTGANATASRLIIARGATWTLDGDVGVSRGRSRSSSLTVSGTLIKSAGSATSTVGVSVTDTGLIEVVSGSLDFTQALGGKGALNIDSGATLGASESVGHALTVSFNGGGGVLALAQPGTFAATIAGFAPGQTIDLVNTAATAASLNSANQLVVVDGAATIATLALAGDFTGDTFNLIADGHGGTDIKVVPHAAAAPLFAQAMAGFAPASPPLTMAAREPIRPEAPTLLRRQA